MCGRTRQGPKVMSCLTTAYRKECNLSHWFWKCNILAICFILVIAFLFLRDADSRKGTLCPFYVPIHKKKERKKKEKEASYHYSCPRMYVSIIVRGSFYFLFHAVAKRGLWLQGCMPVIDWLTVGSTNSNSALVNEQIQFVLIIKIGVVW